MATKCFFWSKFDSYVHFGNIWNLVSALSTLWGSGRSVFLERTHSAYRHSYKIELTEESVTGMHKHHVMIK